MTDWYNADSVTFDVQPPAEVASADYLSSNGVDPNFSGEVTYSPVIDVSSWALPDGGDNSVWGGPTDEDRAFMYGPGGTAVAPEGPSPSGISKALDYLDKNPTLAKFLVAGGAGLLKNVGEQEMLKEQREWMEKEDKRKWERSMDARKFAKVKPMNTGLLGAMQNRKQGVA